MKKVISITVMCCLMFILGRLTTTQPTDTTIEDVLSKSHLIEDVYTETDRDFKSEALYIKQTYKSNMSTSKIKHLLIYIDGMCKHYNLNYNLVKSVISTESAWNYKAKSYVGAKGLMQIMKACAKDYKTPHSEMYDPYVNVTIGIKYLSKLTKRFKDTPTALVAYNEGPRHAERYKREYIDNSRYVNKVTTHFLTFQPQENLAYND